jgi:hypothetical protein
MIELIFAAMIYQATAGEPVEQQQQPPAAQEQTVEQDSAADERQRRRCRVQAVTGSRLGARVCHSQAELDMLSREARDMLQDGMRMWDNQSSGGGNVVCDRPGC